jgi:hypothetical protein
MREWVVDVRGALGLRDAQVIRPTERRRERSALWQHPCARASLGDDLSDVIFLPKPFGFLMYSASILAATGSA